MAIADMFDSVLSISTSLRMPIRGLLFSSASRCRSAACLIPLIPAGNLHRHHLLQSNDSKLHVDLDEAKFIIFKG